MDELTHALTRYGVPLVAWVVGITRLPPGATFQIGLWLIACAAVAVIIGAGLDIATSPARVATASHEGTDVDRL